MGEAEAGGGRCSGGGDDRWLGVVLPQQAVVDLDYSDVAVLLLILSIPVVDILNDEF